MKKETAREFVQQNADFFEKQGLYASIQSVHGDYQIVLREINVPRQLELPLYSRVGDQVPGWKKLGFDRQPTMHDH